MIIKSAEFVTSAVNPPQYPESDMPEIAFAGRSNVGKSSLINSLVNRKRLVKTSSTPGRTQLINFFDINETFSFVDLPGFGFAKVPMRIKKDWAGMINGYLETRPNLAGVVLLMDIRRNPPVKSDLEMIEWLDSHEIPTVIVLTKADKFSNRKMNEHRADIARSLAMPPEDVILFSSKGVLGKKELWTDIETLISLKTSEDKEESV